MNEAYPTYSTSQSAPPPMPAKKGCGCWTIGCLVLTILILLLGGLTVGGGVWAYYYGQSYTSTESQIVPSFDGGDDVFTSAAQKYGLLSQSLQTGQPTSVSFTADELNTAISRIPALNLKDKLFFVIKDGQLQAQFSCPIKALHLPLYTDRYLNGSVDLVPSIQDIPGVGQSIYFNFNTITLNGVTLSQSYAKGFTPSFNQSFNRQIRLNPAIVNVLEHLKAVQITNDQLEIDTQ